MASPPVRRDEVSASGRDHKGTGTTGSCGASVCGSKMGVNGKRVTIFRTPALGIGVLSVQCAACATGWRWRGAGWGG
jgi:hypothetical protein